MFAGADQEGQRVANGHPFAAADVGPSHRPRHRGSWGNEDATNDAMNQVIYNYYHG